MKKLLLFSLPLYLLLSACSQNKVPKWLIGDWIFDPASASQAAKPDTSNQSMEGAMIAALQAMAVTMLTNMEISISQKEIIVSFNGARRLLEISVFKNDGDVCTLKQADGKLIDYHRTKDGFWRLSDDGPMKLHFKRK